MRLDDAFCDNPKVVGLSATSFRAYVHALCYSARHLTDGVVPPAAQTGGKKARAELTESNLWALDDNGSVIIHDYLEWNPPASSVKAKREEDSARKRKGDPDGIQTESAGNPVLNLLGIRASRPVLKEPSPNGEVSSRRQDPIWDSLAEIFGTVAPKTTAHGKRNKATADLRRSGATAESVTIAAKRWQKLFDHATLTDTALAKHYPQLVAGVNLEPPKPPCPTCGTGGGLHAADCEEAA